MSGIAGLYNLDGKPVSRQTIERMTESIAHRGHDGSGSWCDGSTGLGHRMLWTTPESLHETLPFVDQSRGLIITADARVDNRDDLIHLLDFKRRPASEISDSEIILAAYERWGESCPEELLGDFAFAIWDSRRQLLFCARDHFGVRPFYYYLSDKLFAFGSEIKALKCLAEVPCHLNEVRLADFLTPLDDDTTSTCYTEILRLPAAHSITVSPNGKRLSQYWSLDPERQEKLSSDEEYASKFRDIFTEAVRCRLRSAYPIGSMLSGGLDSSSITCVAQELLAQEGADSVRTYSAIFDDVPECDERPFIKSVLAQTHCEASYLHADRMSPLVDLDRMLWHVEELFHASNTHIPWGIYGLAKEQSVRVMLEGYDGDTTVSHGTGYFNELVRQGRWLALATELKSYTKRVTGESWTKAFGAWVWRRGLAPKIFKYRVPRLARKTWGRAHRRISSGNRTISSANYNPFRPGLNSTISQSFVRRVGQETRLKAAHGDRLLTERDSHYRLLTMAVTQSTLEASDKMSGAFSIESRYPFCDKRLAEFCLGLPPEQKLHDGFIRMVMRRGMERILPPLVQWRADKSNLYPAFEHGLRRFEKDRLKKVVQSNTSRLDEYLDMTVLRDIYQRFLSGIATDIEVTAMCRAAILSQWLQCTGLTP